MRVQIRTPKQKNLFRPDWTTNTVHIFVRRVLFFVLPVSILMFSSFLFSKRNCRFGEEISEKYSRLNGGSYDTSEPEEPEDQTSPEYAAYQQWFKQLGGFVLASAKPGVSGSDYFPNQFIPSKVKPDGSADVWYTEDIRTRLGTDCAQIDLLVNDPAYTTDANGDIRCNGEIVACLLKNSRKQLGGI